MELGPSWVSANCAATQEIPSNLLNPKVHYRVHKSPPLVPMLSHINPLCSFLQPPVTSSLFGPNILLNTLFSNALSLHSSLNIRHQVSHPYRTTGKILCILLTKFLRTWFWYHTHQRIVRVRYKQTVRLLASSSLLFGLFSITNRFLYPNNFLSYRALIVE
jgi:hypothetical protein